MWFIWSRRVLVIITFTSSLEKLLQRKHQIYKDQKQTVTLWDTEQIKTFKVKPRQSFRDPTLSIEEVSVQVVWLHEGNCAPSTGQCKVTTPTGGGEVDQED
ncbi:unnamed protein product [Pleuronectes platessa]|uniref:Uncharacterized protein n=1 Tax=Pleuronectes platessa TaxID=8262 RepID=A0A9N7ZCV8_PLEPL|nr:unnamed protein product [Pleuronectes platessa]